MMDLVIAMAPSVDEVTMTKTFELIKPYLEVRVYTSFLMTFPVLSNSFCVKCPYLFYDNFCCFLQTKEPAMQKKAYRVLEELCGGESDECRSFVVTNLETLKVVLLDTLKNASSPAKRVRRLYREKSNKYRFYFISDVWSYLSIRLITLFCSFLAKTEVSVPHSEKPQ